MPDARELCDRAIELAEQGRFDEANLAKITPLSPTSDIQTRLVKEK